jgi:hypothetical protein
MAIYGAEEDYQVALFAYYLALNIQELVDLLVAGREKILAQRELRLEIPLLNHTLPLEVHQKAYRLLLRSPEDVRDIWRKAGVSRAKMAEHWPAWITHCAAWLSQAYQFGYDGRIAHEKLFEDIRPEAGDAPSLKGQS